MLKNTLAVLAGAFLTSLLSNLEMYQSQVSGHEQAVVVATIFVIRALISGFTQWVNTSKKEVEPQG